MKKILFVTLYESGAIFHAAILELIHRYQKEGIQCDVLNCRGREIACDYNPTKSFLHCLSCRIQTHRGNSRLPKAVRKFSLDEFFDVDDVAAAEDAFENLASKGKFTKKSTYQKFDWGAGVFSTVVSRTRDICPESFAQKYPDLSRSLAVSSRIVYQSVDRILKEQGYDKTYLCNGRHACLRAIMRASEANNVEFATIEGGHDLDHYGVFENSTPHDIQARYRVMLKQWEDDPEGMKARAIEFYEKRFAGVKSKELTMRSYTQSQKKRLLPDSWDDKFHNVSIFCSSEDEYVSVGGQWEIPIYKGQAEALEAISESLEEENDSNVRIFLRVHPNLKGIYNSFVQRIKVLDRENFVVVPADSPIDSYELMLSSDTVVSFGSTIGIEAVYFGRPSVLLGAAFYRPLGACYTADSHQEVMELLRRKLKPKGRIAALIYAGHMMGFGRKFEMSKVGDNVAEVMFNGYNLNGNFLHRNLLKIYRKRYNKITKSIEKAQSAAKDIFENPIN